MTTFSTSSDDSAGDRGHTGVVATLSSTSDSSVRLILDDVASMSMLDTAAWEKEHLYTFVDFDADRFFRNELSDKELRDIGLSLVARLVARQRKE